MTPEEQWAVINTRAFLLAMLDRIKGIISTMQTADVKADQITTTAQDIPIVYRVVGDLITIEIGTTVGGDPQTVLNIPLQWVVGA